MFGKGKKGFKNYAKFFCLNESYDGKHNWVTEDCLAVYDLLSENNKKTLPIMKSGYQQTIYYQKRKTNGGHFITISCCT